MKSAFILTDGHLASAMVPVGTKDILNLGDRITVSRPLEAGYGACIKVGELGTIDFVDASTGLVEVLMDTPHKGLQQWDNHLWLEPYGTEDLEDGITLAPYKCRRHIRLSSMPRWARAVAASVLVGAVTAVVHDYFFIEPLHTLFVYGEPMATAQIFWRGIITTLVLTGAISALA